ncbi:MAG: sensor histidine kinase [Pyrinomonadaceae bacterium MAG19_C2-C3]|nr:sensor histidine kinase [Pyrinomonadaceae bacterium MAG19_C2-C3]
MTTLNIAALINLLGWALGFALYAMLLLMSVRRSGVTTRGNLFKARRDERANATAGNLALLPLVTALLGLLWNAGALVTGGLQEFDAQRAGTPGFLLLGAASFAALGFLPAVVVHSAADSLNRSTDSNNLSAHLLTIVAYVLSGIAAVMHFASAFSDGKTSSTAALYILTAGYVLLMAGLFLFTRGETGARRAVWATALAVFAVSALHLSTGDNHPNHERWYAELIGHHASLPLALAILYQDYRFAFADIFLKRALSLLALVALIGAAFSVCVWLFAAPVTGEAGGEVRLNPVAVGILLAMWAGTALLYPWLRRATEWFIDNVVLRRADYDLLRAEIARRAQEHQTSAELLDDISARLEAVLTASSVAWREVVSTTNPPDRKHSNTSGDEDIDTEMFAPLPSQVVNIHARGSARVASVLVPTTDAPHYEIIIGELAGGRRLLSDDIEMLEWVAVTLARRIDALRVTHERCEQVQREQEIAKLATEAQLRALRAQINPHFLFNALTTIGYLIQTSPQRALETLMRLTDLLRRVLRATSEWVTLGEELKLIEAYLDIERARFEERLRVRFDVGWELDDLLVPSLIVQPIVENAVKHGIAPQKAGGEIYIAARLEGDTLIISVRDTGAGVGSVKLIEGRQSGVGLQNVEQRLRLCCGEAGRLTFESAPDSGAIVELRLPARHQRRDTRTQAETNEANVTASVTTHRANADAPGTKAVMTRRVG